MLNIINYEQFKTFASNTKNANTIEEIDVFFNYLKKYMQECSKGNEEVAEKLLHKAGRVICDLNSKCHKETKKYFLTNIINICDSKQLENLMGCFLLGIIKSEKMLSDDTEVFIEVSKKVI